MIVYISNNISVMGTETNCSSKMLSGYVPVFNATAAERLINAGITIDKKLALNEFNMGHSELAISLQAALKESSEKGDKFLALASDTGGEARMAASGLGLTLIKPTYGSVSRYGLIENATSLDQICTIAQNTDDCAGLLSVISGKDNKDGTCVLEEPFNFSQASGDYLKGKKIGMVKNHGTGFSAEKTTALTDTAGLFTEAGVSVKEFEMPHLDYTFPVYYIIACAEASSNLSKYDGLKFGHRSEKADNLIDTYKLSRSEGFGWEVKKRILFGSLVLSRDYYDKYYRKALQGRSLIIDSYKKLFKDYDMILAPVTESINVSVNLAGLPSIAIPSPNTFQLIGPAFSERDLVTAGRLYEKLAGKKS